MRKMKYALTAILAAGVLTACGSQKPAETTAAPATQATEAQAADTQAAEEAKTENTFKMAKPADFYVSSSAGGNSDIFSRTIADIASSKGLINEQIIVQNNVDGQGQIARRTVATSKTPNESLLCLSSGDLTVMITVGGLTMDDFRPIAIMAADKHLAFTNVNGKYKTIQDVIDAAKNGEKIVVGGTSGDERTVFNMMVDEMQLGDNFSYVVYGSSSESLTALLGDHVDLAMGKPAAAREYVVSGDIAPILALSTERFGEPFQDAPILSELGYNNVEFPLYRGLVGAKNMSDEALDFWVNVMKEVSETDEWQDYLQKSQLQSTYLDQQATAEAFAKVEAEAKAAAAQK